MGEISMGEASVGFECLWGFDLVDGEVLGEFGVMTSIGRIEEDGQKRVGGAE